MLTRMICSLPLQIGSKVSVKDYNNFLDHQVSTGLRFHFVDGKVYIVDMTLTNRQDVVALLQSYFDLPNGPDPNNKLIKVLGRPCKRFPF